VKYKSPDNTWDKEFKTHEFSDRQIEIMKFFNVRYKCLDARDDFSAKCKKLSDVPLQYLWATSEQIDQMDNEYSVESAYNGDDFETIQEQFESSLDSPDSIGRITRKRQEAMIVAERIMKSSGWMDECIDGLPDIETLKPLQPYLTTIFNTTSYSMANCSSH
jgi:hypothetical protein